MEEMNEKEEIKDRGDKLNVIHVEDPEGGDEDEGVAAAVVGLLLAIIATGAVMVGYGLFKGLTKKD